MRKFILLVLIFVIFSCEKENEVIVPETPTVTKNWIHIFNTNAFIKCFAVAENKIFAGANNLSNPGFICSSSDSGTTWEIETTGLPSFVNIECLAVNGSDIYAGTYNGQGIYLSTDLGENWNPINGNLPISSIRVRALAISGNNIFAGTGRGIYISSNNGDSWELKNTGLCFNLAVFAITLNNNSIFAATDCGLYLSTNNGNSWDSLNTGLPDNTVFRSVAINENKIFASAEYSVYTSTDNGNSWSKNSKVFSAPIHSFEISGSNIFAVTDQGVHLSTDNGESWTVIKNEGLPSDFQYLSMVKYGDYIYTGSYLGVWRMLL